MSTNNCPLQTNLACFITTDAINIEQMSFYRHHVVTLVKKHLPENMPMQKSSNNFSSMSFNPDAHCCHMGTAIKHPVPDDLSRHL